MEIYTVRHGETNLNVKKVAQGAGTDEPLNDNGRNQAAHAINLPEKIDYIFCSPMLRAKETADIINKKINTEIVYHPLLIERDYGEFEGLNREDYPFRDFWNYSLNSQYEKAENIQNLFNRTTSFLENIKKEYEGKNILVVTHGGVIRAMNAQITKNYNTDDIINSLPNNCEVRKYII